MRKVSYVGLIILMAFLAIAAIQPYPKFKAFDTDGNPLSGGKVYTYEPGTTTDKATYSEYTLTTPNTNPIILDSNGEATIFTNGYTKFVLKTSADVTIWTQDYVGDPTITSLADLKLAAPVVDARYYGTAGLRATIDAAVTAIGANAKTLYLAPGTWVGVGSGDSNLTIPSNINLKCDRGAYLTVANGKTLTINGSVEAGPWQIFSLTGTGTVSFATSKKTSYVIPHWWGAAADGTTNDYAALAACLASGAKVVDGLGYSYKSSTSGLTMGSAQTLRNFGLVSGASSYPFSMLVPTTNSKILQGTFTGTLTTASTDYEYGIDGTGNSLNGVVVDDCRFTAMSTGIKIAPTTTAYPARTNFPERWRIRATFEDLGGTGASGYGYGVLAQANHCDIDVIGYNVPRHVVYLTAGASWNKVKAISNGCKYNVAGTNSYLSLTQPWCEFNTFEVTCYDFDNTYKASPSESRGIGLYNQSRHNTVKNCLINGDAYLKYPIEVEGTAAEGYPTDNVISNNSINGDCTGNKIRLLNARNTLVEGNHISGTNSNAGGVTGFIQITDDAGFTADTLGLITGNFIDLENGVEIGIHNGCTNSNAPLSMGTNHIINQNAAAGCYSVNNYSTGRVHGFSKVYSGIVSVAGLGATTWSGAQAVTLPAEMRWYDDPNIRFARVTASVVGQSVDPDVPSLAIVDAITATGFNIYVYNGDGGAQDMTVHWVAYGH